MADIPPLAGAEQPERSSYGAPGADLRYKVRSGLLLAILGYSALAIGNALVKSLDGELSIFAIGFYQTGTAAVLVLMFKPRRETWREALRVKRAGAVAGRAIAGVAASMLGIVAIMHLPLSDAYALFFLSPVFSALLARRFLGENIQVSQWAAVLLGFLGVLFVVKPGFVTLEFGHLAAVGVAIAMAAGILLLRTVARSESRTSVLFWLLISAAACYGAALMATGGDYLSGWPQLFRALGAGLCSAVGQLALLFAAQRTAASRVAPAQYSQLILATGLGIFFFGEYPDLLKLCGLVLIAAAGLLLLRGERLS